MLARHYLPPTVWAAIQRGEGVTGWIDPLPIQRLDQLHRVYPGCSIRILFRTAGAIRLRRRVPSRVHLLRLSSCEG
jgi:hypothetical protein